MNELRSILKAWRDAGPGRDKSVLATVVHVVGSAYRRPGARMLILPDGRRLGTISGGCLEGDVVRKANWWTSDTGTALRVFDNTTEDAAWEFGLGCNGVISVLLERTGNPEVQAVLEFLDARQATKQPAVVATVIRCAEDDPCQVGDRLLFDGEASVGAALRGSDLEAEISPAIQAVFHDRSHRLVHLSSVEIFVEWVGPPQRLVIFGAGHDVVPVVTLAHLMGWRVTVADRPSSYVQPHRFPGAEQVIALPAVGGVESLEIDADTAVVVMTHNFPQDRALLPPILKQRPRYLGLLGPKSRAVKLFEENGEDIRRWDVHAPIGLDIGSDHPETLALSIVAEIHAVLARRPGGPLRQRDGPIHGAPKEWGSPTSRHGRCPDENAVATCSIGDGSPYG